MYLLDASVRRRMCKRFLQGEGNAVLGYHQLLIWKGFLTSFEDIWNSCPCWERYRGRKFSLFQRNHRPHRQRQTLESILHRLNIKTYVDMRQRSIRLKYHTWSLMCRTIWCLYPSYSTVTAAREGVLEYTICS